ncbi:hypothetical protein GCM10008012_28380 [Rhizobium anhuiense]|nr:hypothetical protein GCM10008012_28380 [Rhizobium anhuiense]
MVVAGDPHPGTLAIRLVPPSATTRRVHAPKACLADQHHRPRLRDKHAALFRDDSVRGISIRAGEWRKSHTPQAAGSPQGKISISTRMNIGLKARRHDRQ